MRRKKIKKLISYLLFTALFLSFPSFNLSFNLFADAQDKIAIKECADLQLIGNDSSYPMNGIYNLKNDIDCDGIEFKPIGLNNENSNFEGVFNGNNYKIKNLTIDRKEDRVGLFSKVDETGEISNVKLKDVAIKGDKQAGGLVGYNRGVVKNSSVEGGYVEGGDYVGGLIATNYKGLIKNSHSAATITGNDYIGGFVGWNDRATIEDSYSEGDVSGGKKIGGFAGKNDNGVIVRSYSEGRVDGQNNQVGGFLGYNRFSIIEESYSEGDVKGLHWGVGGFAGFNEGSIKNSHSSGSVDWIYHEEATEGAVGGFVGYNYEESVENSYSTGDVGSDGNNGENIGGFAGYIDSGSIENSYSTGSVLGSGENFGLFAGKNDGVIDISFSLESNEKKCTGKSNTGATTNCELVEKVDYFYNYNEDPLKSLYDKWDFRRSWSEKNIGGDYPVLGWRVSSPEEERSSRTTSLARTNQRPIPWYQNPLYAEQSQNMTRSIRELRAGLTEVEKEVNYLIEAMQNISQRFSR